jgi:hypothetical protein
VTAHGALEADYPPGATVVYAARYGDLSQAGQVVRANYHYVFVRFERGKPSKAVAPEWLTVVADPIPDPRIQMLEDVLEQSKREAIATDEWDERLSGLVDALTDVLVGAVDSSSEEES